MISYLLEGMSENNNNKEPLLDKVSEVIVSYAWKQQTERGTGNSPKSKFSSSGRE